MAEQEKIAGFALVDDFNADVLKTLGNCFYNNNIIPVVISLKKGRNVVDQEKMIMTETDLTFNRARTQIDVLILADDFSTDQLKEHGPFQKIVQKMIEESQLVVAMGKSPIILAQLGLAKGRMVTGNSEAIAKLKEAGAQVVDQPVVEDGNLITAQSIEQAEIMCTRLSELLSKAA